MKLQLGFPETSISELRFNSAVLRIAFGGIALHRAISLYGASLYGSELEVGSTALIILAFLLTVGFCTPVTALLLGGLNLYLLHNLGPMVGMMACIYIAVARGGEQLSIDNLLSKIPFFKCLQNNFNKILPSPKHSRNIAIILFAGVSWSAMMFHFEDRLWIHGAVLPFLFTNSYLSDTSLIFEKLQANHPILISILLKITIYIQGYFELFSWFFLGSVAGRRFVAIWGLGFFIASHFLMNLMYLPVIEIFFWISLFNFTDTIGWIKNYCIVYDDNCGLCTQTIIRISKLNFFENLSFCGFSSWANQESVNLTSKLKSLSPNNFYVFEVKSKKTYENFDAYCTLIRNSVFWPLYPFMVIMNFTGLGPLIWESIAKNRQNISIKCNLRSGNDLQTRLNIERSVHNSNSLLNMLWVFASLSSVISFNFFAYFQIFYSKPLPKAPMPIWKYTGQGFVNVFNKTDLNLNQYSLVICRKDKKRFPGKNLLVPFQDNNGGRLSYLANDYIYFRNSLKFQRATINNSIAEAKSKAVELSKFIVKLDSSITGETNYKTYLLKRKSFSRYGSSFPNSWGESNVVSEWASIVDPKKIAKKRFIISPSHLMEKTRYESTNNLYCFS